MKRIIAPVILGLGLVLAGCGSTSHDAGSAPAPEQHAVPEGSDGSAEQDEDPGATEANRQVIATGDMRVITDDPSDAADGIAQHGDSRGGYVESREEWADRGGEAVVDITLRVPAEEFEQLMTDVEGAGEVVERSQSAEDVTGAVRDLDSRISALETSTERLEGIMGEADSASDLLEAEQALSERQGELESLVAQRDDLEDQVSMSTLQVELRESDSGGDRGGFAEWLGALGTTLVASAGGLVLVLAALLPWVIVVGVPGWFIARWLIRRNRSRKAAQGRTWAHDRRAAGGDDRSERTDGQKTDAREPTGETSGS
ncbi:DUF4349 domain-containing protein [Brevibacterium senegalense]|uniref:DUF4349 domain-containing protein n=1 Tax=Brevibacterium senegalense TaxID=1033736 RepID=UPI0002EB6975|nr:DUF4349 domain-containing protein [Brevibacterium senegalense]